MVLCVSAVSEERGFTMFPCATVAGTSVATVAVGRPWNGVLVKLLVTSKR
jgi:hypothetical protein